MRGNAKKVLGRSKQKGAARKRQQKFCVNQKGKIQVTEEQTGAKLSKKLQEQEKHADKEELIAANS